MISLMPLTYVDRETTRRINVLLRQLSPHAKRISSAHLIRVIDPHNGVLFVVRDDKKIIGVGKLIWLFAPMWFSARIENVVIDSAYRGRGLGKMLVEKNDCTRQSQTRRVCGIDQRTRTHCRKPALSKARVSEKRYQCLPSPAIMIILDFDGVLFNDRRFKRDYVKIFQRFGVPYAAYWKAYAAAKLKTGGYYSPEAHIAALKVSRQHLPTRVLQNTIRFFATQCFAYVYGDARPFLDYFHKKNIALALLSTGSPFQKRKISASGIAPFFEKVIIVKNPSKVEALAKLAGDEEGTIFIDDKKEVVEEVKKSLHWVTVLQLVRGRQKRSTMVDAVIPSLAAARRLISKLQ